jgi:hypothetical protein
MLRRIKMYLRGIRRRDYFTRESWAAYVGYRSGKIPEWNLSISPLDYECLVFSKKQLDYIYGISSGRPYVFVPIRDINAVEESIDGVVRIYYNIVWDSGIYYDTIYDTNDISYRGISLIDNISYPVVGLGVINEGSGLDGEKGGLQKFIF